MRMITAFQAENGKIYALEEQAIQEDETDRIFDELENYGIFKLFDHGDEERRKIAIWIAEHFTRKLR